MVRVLVKSVYCHKEIAIVCHLRIFSCELCNQCTSYIPRLFIGCVVEVLGKQTYVIAIEAKSLFDVRSQVFSEQMYISAIEMSGQSPLKSTQNQCSYVMYKL